MSAPNNNKYLLGVNQPAPLNFSIGPYDGVILKSAKPNRAFPEMKNPMMVYQGTPLPLASEAVPVSIPKGSMFMFAHNRSNLKCRSTYTTDKGYVCSTGAQQKLVGEKRGNNKNWPNGSF